MVKSAQVPFGYLSGLPSLPSYLAQYLDTFPCFSLTSFTFPCLAICGRDTAAQPVALSMSAFVHPCLRLSIAITIEIFVRLAFGAVVRLPVLLAFDTAIGSTSRALMGQGLLGIFRRPAIPLIRSRRIDEVIIWTLN